ncbi:MAG: FecR domain-containing protein [Bacteroidales bacterium]|nr:FecR domain-containing protein [Bacteroidales bacterium]
MNVLKMPYKAILKMLDSKAQENDYQMYMNQIDSESHHNKEHMRIQKIWNESENARKFDQINVLDDWKAVRSRIRKTMSAGTERMSLTLILSRIAAVMILAIGLGFVFYKVLTSQKVQTVKVYTYRAERTVEEVYMPDGSVINLNIGSSLTYRDDFNHSGRDVVLEGEGLFDVVPGHKLPFRVFTGETVIEVTGTIFSVYEKEGVVKVAVIDGTVKLSSVDDSNTQLQISRNQSGYMLPNKELKIKDGIDANNLSWKTRLLIFDETPLDSALIDIAHYFRRNLAIESDISEKVTAEFENQPLNEILDELEQVSGLVFDTTGGSLTVKR